MGRSPIASAGCRCLPEALSPRRVGDPSSPSPPCGARQHQMLSPERGSASDRADKRDALTVGIAGKANLTGTVWWGGAASPVIERPAPPTLGGAVAWQRMGGSSCFVLAAALPRKQPTCPAIPSRSDAPVPDAGARVLSQEIRSGSQMCQRAYRDTPSTESVHQHHAGAPIRADA